MIILDIKEFCSAGGGSYFKKAIKKWPPEIQLMAINQLGRIEGKDVFKLEKQGEIGLYRRLPPPKLHEFWVKNEANEAEIQIMGRGKTRNVQYRVCLTMIGSIAFIVHAYIHKGGKKSRQNEDDIKLAHKRAKEAHRQFGTDQR